LVLALADHLNDRPLGFVSSVNNTSRGGKQTKKKSLVNGHLTVINSHLDSTDFISLEDQLHLNIAPPAAQRAKRATEVLVNFLG